MIKKWLQSCLILAVLVFISGSVQAQSWDFEDQELDIRAGENSTLEITDERSESGTYSVEFTADDNEAQFSATSGLDDLNVFKENIPTSK